MKRGREDHAGGGVTFYFRELELAYKPSICHCF